MRKFLGLLADGLTHQVSSLLTSAGAASSGEIPGLDSNGRLDLSFMPIGIGPDIKYAIASEALAAGSYVNLYNNAGVINARLADNSNGRKANGFVRTAVASAATALVYFDVPNDAVTGLTPSERRYLGTAGGTIAVPLDPNLVANAGKYHQFIGEALDVATLNTDLADVIVL